MSSSRTCPTRRRVVFAGLTTAGAAVLAACGRGTPSGSAGEAPKLVRPAVTLEYWSRWGPPTAEVEEGRVAEFAAANAPTRVERTTMTGSYIEKLNAAFAAGSGPDVYTVGGSGVPNFAAKGAALTLETYAAVQKDLADFFPATIEASKYRGKLAGLPYIVDIREMIYRKDLFREAGLDAERFPDTWQALRDGAKRITKWDGQDLRVAGFDVPNGTNAHDFFLTLVEQQGEHPFSADISKPTFNGAAGRVALQLMVDMLHRDRIDAIERPPAPPGQNVITAGQAAVTWASAGQVNAARRAAPEIAEHVGTARTPRLDKRVTYMGGTSLMVSAKPKDAAAAIDLLLFLTAPAHVEAICKIQNGVPPRQSAAGTPYVRDPLIKVFFDAVAYGWSYPNHAYYTEIREAINTELAAALQLKKAPQAALDDAARASQDFLARTS